MEYLSIPNWEDYQHYKDRNPPWIKLHNQLLENYDFECLPDASKAHLLCIWMLASRTSNKIKADSKWIARKIGANEPVNLQVLIESGFLLKSHKDMRVKQDASMPLHMENKSVPLEEERQSREEDINTSTKLPNCPYGSITDLYRKILVSSGLNDVKDHNEWSKKRKSHVQARWRDKPDLNYWERLFIFIRDKNDFLMGKNQDQNGKVFKVDLDWIFNENNLLKIMEGKYQ